MLTIKTGNDDKHNIYSDRNSEKSDGHFISKIYFTSLDKLKAEICKF